MDVLVVIGSGLGNGERHGHWEGWHRRPTRSDAQPKSGATVSRRPPRPLEDLGLGEANSESAQRQIDVGSGAAHLA